jgi:hypothetical protein
MKRELKKNKKVFNTFSLILFAVVVIEIILIANSTFIGNAVKSVGSKNVISREEISSFQKMIVTSNDYKFEKSLGYDQIKLANYEYTYDIGKPELPIKVLTLSIPIDKRVKNIEINYKEKKELNGFFKIMPVQPSKQCCEKEVDLGYADFVEPNSIIYNSDQPYPNKIVESFDGGYFQGHKVVKIKVYPFQYFPKTGKIVSYINPSFKLILEDSNYDEIKSVSNDLSNTELKKIADNPNDVSTNYYKSGNLARASVTYVNYLIITSQSLVNTFQPLVSHKQSKGLTTEILTTDYIYGHYSGEDNQAKIRNAIIDYHQNKGTSWVLLGGDEEVIPIRYCSSFDTTVTPSLDLLQICDIYYSALDGNWDLDGDGIYGEPTNDTADLYPDVYLGRIPLHDPIKIINWINKLIKYETNPGNGSASYLSKVAYVSSDQMRDYNLIGEHIYLSQHFPQVFNQNLVSNIEQPSGNATNPTQPSGQNVVSELSQGYGFIFFLNHGRTDGFVVKSSGYSGYPKSFILTSPNSDNGDLNSINNIDKSGIVLTISCDVGAFDAEKWFDPNVAPSPAETFLALENKGAVAVIAYGRWGWVATSWQIEDEFLRQLFIDNSNKHIGELYVLAKSQATYYRDEMYGLNLYGDPEMVVYTCQQDNDEDSYTICNNDCNDNDPNINPSEPDIHDGVDNNCNGLIDEGYFSFSFLPSYDAYLNYNGTISNSEDELCAQANTLKSYLKFETRFNISDIKSARLTLWKNDALPLKPKLYKINDYGNLGLEDWNSPEKQFIANIPQVLGYVTFDVSNYITSPTTSFLIEANDYPSSRTCFYSSRVYNPEVRPKLDVVSYSEQWKCGDANSDGIVDISDVTYLNNYIFAGGSAPNPLLAGDSNNDGSIDVSDAVYLVNYIFSGGPAPCSVPKNYVKNTNIQTKDQMNNYLQSAQQKASVSKKISVA